METSTSPSGQHTTFSIIPTRSGTETVTYRESLTPTGTVTYTTVPTISGSTTYVEVPTSNGYETLTETTSTTRDGGVITYVTE